MIVELTPSDITRLSLGDDVQVGGVTVRMGASLVESIANGVESLPKAAPKKNAVVFAMHAKYPGRCGKCARFLKAGGPIIRDVRDAENKLTLCMACGEPVLAAYERETGTSV